MAMVYDLPPNFAGGAFFIGWRGRKFGANDVNDYFGVMDVLRPLFGQLGFNTSTIGFYLNRIDGFNNAAPDDIAVRLTYFSIDVPETIRAVEQFVNHSKDLAIHKGEHANRDKPTAQYNDGSSELAFKNFLNANTQICLEVLQDLGRDQTRNLVQDYISINLLQQAKRPEPVLSSRFAQHSSTYRDLIRRGLVRRYWDDMFRWHRPDSVGIHFMCNMLMVGEPNVGWGFPRIRVLFQQLLNAP